jgi:hypothetical protein
MTPPRLNRMRPDCEYNGGPDPGQSREPQPTPRDKTENRERVEQDGPARDLAGAALEAGALYFAFSTYSARMPGMVISAPIIEV